MTEKSARPRGKFDALMRIARSRALFVAVGVLGSVVAFGNQVGAQDGRVRTSETGTVALRQAIRDLGSDTQALLVTSHPDDLYLLLGTYLRFALGWRVEVVLLTRGEGGQNLVGPETGDELRRIRTLESEAAAERLGIRLWYANLPDRGYCRSAEEAFAEWGRRETIQRMAQAIRKIRPDVILTTIHPQEPHGHDLALIEALPLAVELAADPGAQGLSGNPFRVDQVFRAASPAKKATRGDERDQRAEQSELYLEVDEIESVRGDTFRRLSYRVLAEEHKTQRPIEAIETLFPERIGMVRVPVFGLRPERGDTLVESLTGELPALFSAVVDRGVRLSLRTSLEQTLPMASGEPSRFLALALAVRRELRELRLDPAMGDDAERRRALRLEALDRAIVQAAGLRVVAETARDAIAVPGKALPVTVRVHAGAPKQVSVLELESSSGSKLAVKSTLPATLERRESLAIFAEFTAPSGRDQNGKPVGNGSVVQGRTDPFRSERYEPPVQLSLTVAIEGERIDIPFSVATELRQALELSVTPRNLLLPSGVRQARFAVRVRKNVDEPFTGKFKVTAPTSWAVSKPIEDVALDREVVKDFTFDVTLPELFDDGSAAITVQLGDARVTVRAQRVELEIDRSLTVGLVRGVDDAAEAALRGLAVQVRTLGDEDLTLGSLDDLKTIVVDIRALKLREAARAAFGRLLRFAERGGRLIVLSHKEVEFNLDVARFQGAPFPLRIGKGRITNENAPVSILLPDHPILNVPNKIRQQDWDGWVQERGLYFAESFDEHYQALLAMRENERMPEERGALLYAQYGKGDYVYCGLALFRQWKSLHPGACRLLANLVTPRS